jgi:DNA repair photolyase
MTEKTAAKSTRPARAPTVRPDNRYASARYDEAGEQDDWGPGGLADEFAKDPRVQWIEEPARSIITRNQSPDIPFEASLNPYRGCEHGCSYCYARPTHEALGDDAGIGFESKIYVKVNAPELLEAELAKRGYAPSTIHFSGVTDCYQRAERHYKLTRRCLEVLARHHHPAAIITKNALVLRDLDVLTRMAEERLIAVNVSITTLDQDLAATMEPKAAPPRLRLETVRRLSAAGVPVGVMVAPVVPGLTDHETPKILEAAAAAGAQWAGSVLLRLPLTVKDVFFAWLESARPGEAKKVIHRQMAMRGGETNDPRWGTRFTGEGVEAEQQAKVFRVFAARYGLDGPYPELDASRFVPVVPRPGAWVQAGLFGD